jgi:ABC-type nickel/cobalt efflux system permease component RcnA
MKEKYKYMIKVILVICIVIAVAFIWSLATTMIYSESTNNWSFENLLSHQNISKTVGLLVISFITYFGLKLLSSNNDKDS